MGGRARPRRHLQLIPFLSTSWVESCHNLWGVWGRCATAGSNKSRDTTAQIRFSLTRLIQKHKKTENGITSEADVPKFPSLLFSTKAVTYFIVRFLGKSPKFY